MLRMNNYLEASEIVEVDEIMEKFDVFWVHMKRIVFNSWENQMMTLKAQKWI